MHSCDRFQSPARTKINRVIIAGSEHAVVLLSTEGTSSSGYKLADRAAWICKIVDGKLKEVDNYCDTAAINE
jgi:ketosteroid isomerase-like protein